MNTFRSVASIVLAIFVLASSTSFVVGMHICMGEIQNIALFRKAEGCEKERSLPPCHRHTKAPCCEDEVYFHAGEDFNTSFKNVDIRKPAFVSAAQVYLFLSEIIPSDQMNRITYDPYDPPWRTCDRTVELQVFLI